MAAKDYINPNGFEIPTVPIAEDAYANVKPFEYNEYDVESLGQTEIDRIIAAHNVNEIKIVLMYAVLKDEKGEYYIKDGERINL